MINTTSQLKYSIKSIEQISSIFNDEANKIPRETTLKSILINNNIKYTTDKTAVYTNFIVPLYKTKVPKFAIGAHFDKVNYSKGINDNAVSIALLLQLAKNFQDKDLPIEIVFFDKEETGMLGSSSYAKNNKNISHVLVLDIIGFGEVPVMCLPHLSEQYLPEITRIENSLPSDNYALMANGLNSTLIVTVPTTDLQLNQKNEYELVPVPKFYSSFHNRYFDDIRYINWKVVNQLYKFIENYIIQLGEENE